MLSEKLKNYQLILASGSPRRQQFFKDLGLEFKIQLRPVNEIYPEDLTRDGISDYLSVLKANAFNGSLQAQDILITSDTIVWHERKALGKPKDYDDACNMLKSMSAKTHEVITSVCFTSKDKQIVVNATTEVTFKALSDAEISYYINNYKPYDKAGAYGIQEWIGHIGITEINGSYFNVVGLPTHLVYETLNRMVD